MAGVMRKVSDYFGLTPGANDEYADAYEADGYEDYERQPYDREARDDYDRESMPRSGSSRFLADREPVREPVRDPEHHFVELRSDFQDQYSKAPEIGRSFRSGDIVSFDLSALDDAQRKRYVDFAAGLAFALRGRIITNGPVMTLLPEGVSQKNVEPQRRASI